MDYKRAFTWLCVAAVALLLFLGALIGTIASARSMARALLAAEQKHSAELEAQISVLRVDIAAARAEAKQSSILAAAALERANEEAEARRRAAAAAADAEAKLKDAPPETLVAETRRILGTAEVWYKPEAGTIELSLAAFRTAAVRLHDWADFTLVREPAYAREISGLRSSLAAKASEISSLNVGIAGLEATIKLKDEQYAGLRNTLEEITRLAFVPWWERASIRFAWGIGGCVIGTLVERARGRKN